MYFSITCKSSTGIILSLFSKKHCLSRQIQKNAEGMLLTHRLLPFVGIPFWEEGVGI